MVAGDFFTHEGGTEGKIKYTDYKRKVNMNMKRISARISALILALVLGVCVFVSISCAASKTDSLPIPEPLSRHAQRAPVRQTGTVPLSQTQRKKS